MKLDKDLAQTIKDSAEEMSKAFDKMAKGINTELNKLRAKVSELFIDEFIVYEDDNYIVVKNNSKIVYFEKLPNNEVEEIDSENIPDSIKEEVSKELI